MTKTTLALVYAKPTPEVWAMLSLLYWQELPVKQVVDFGLCMRLSKGRQTPTLASYDKVLAQGYKELYEYLEQEGLFQM